jgi:hypothetical protein
VAGAVVDAVSVAGGVSTPVVALPSVTAATADWLVVVSAASVGVDAAAVEPVTVAVLEACSAIGDWPSPEPPPQAVMAAVRARAMLVAMREPEML